MITRTRIPTLLSGTFAPTDLTGLVIWLDATDISSLTFNGSNISQWQDRSGRGNHAIQGTAINQPKYVAGAINGVPALEFRHDGTNGSQLTVNDSASLDYTEFEAFTVIRRVADRNNTETILGKLNGHGSAHEFRLFIAGTGDLLQNAASPDGGSVNLKAVTVTSPAAALATPYLVHGRLTQGTLYASLAGQQAPTTSLASVFNSTAPFRIGSVGGAGEPLAGQIGEVLFFTRSLNATERQSVTSYLRGKWKI